MFKKIKMGGNFWAVFLINPKDENDRYMVTCTMDKEKDVDHFVAEFERIANV
jgi:hypothetical protein